MSLLGALIFPPLAALLIYILIVYVFAPAYRKRQRYSQYMPVSLPGGVGAASGSLLERWRNRLLALISPYTQSRYRERRFSGLSDEELDPVDGLEELHEHLPDTDRSFDGEQPRLSRDLEAGFMDDSDGEPERARI